MLISLHVVSSQSKYSKSALDTCVSFYQYGKIIECRTLVDPKTTISRCTAFVQFDTRREAKVNRIGVSWRRAIPLESVPTLVNPLILYRPAGIPYMKIVHV